MALSALNAFKAGRRWASMYHCMFNRPGKPGKGPKKYTLFFSRESWAFGTMHKVCAAQSFCFFDIKKHVRLNHSFTSGAGRNLSWSGVPARYVQFRLVTLIAFRLWFWKMYVPEPGSYELWAILAGWHFANHHAGDCGQSPFTEHATAKNSRVTTHVSWILVDN